MTEDLNKPLVFERQVKIELTSQARKVLSHIGVNPETVVDDYIKNNKFSIGGHNIVIYLERLG